jgi:hypothetical protein
VDFENRIESAREVAFEALFEEFRLAKIEAIWVPVNSYLFAGQVCMYIDRDPNDAMDNDFSEAILEHEKVFGNYRDHLKIVWTPRGPQDRTWQTLLGGVSLADIKLITSILHNTYNANECTDSALVGHVITRTYIEFRGRNHTT